jgi:hypothetical protein
LFFAELSGLVDAGGVLWSWPKDVSGIRGIIAKSTTQQDSGLLRPLHSMEVMGFTSWVVSNVERFASDARTLRSQLLNLEYVFEYE